MEDRFLLLQVVRSIENTVEKVNDGSSRRFISNILKTEQGNLIAKPAQEIASELKISVDRVRRLIKKLQRLNIITLVERLASKNYEQTNYYLINQTAVEILLIEPLKEFSIELQSYLGD